MRKAAQIDKRHASRRQSGRALTVVLAFMALGSVSALAYGVVQTFVPADDPADTFDAGTDSNRSAISKPASSASRSARSADARSLDAAAARTGDPNRTGSIASQRAGSATNNARRAAARRNQREGDVAQAARDDWSGGGRVASDAAANRNSARFSPQSSSSNSAADAPPASDGENASDPNDSRTPYTPGYVDVLGVVPNTPAHRAGIRKGAKILEYNGQPVTGRLALEEAWSAPNLPEAVPLVYEDRYGHTHETTVQPGDLKAPLGQAYE